MGKTLLLALVLSIVLLSAGTAIADEGYMEDEDHMEGGMMEWWTNGNNSWLGIPYMGLMMMGYWLVFVVVAILVYKDAEERGMSGLLWFVLVILPWIGILFLVIYLITRKDRMAIGQNKSPGAVMDDRYARGEISRDEYLQMKKDMQ